MAVPHTFSGTGTVPVLAIRITATVRPGALRSLPTTCCWFSGAKLFAPTHVPPGTLIITSAIGTDPMVPAPADPFHGATAPTRARTADATRMRFTLDDATTMQPAPGEIRTILINVR